MVDIEKNNLFYYIFIDVDGFYRFIRPGLQGFRYEFVIACHEKVAGTCHAERERSIRVGHAARLVRPDASLPLSMTRQGDDSPVIYLFQRKGEAGERASACARRERWQKIHRRYVRCLCGWPGPQYAEER